MTTKDRDPDLYADALAVTEDFDRRIETEDLGESLSALGFAAGGHGAVILRLANQVERLTSEVDALRAERDR